LHRAGMLCLRPPRFRRQEMTQEWGFRAPEVPRLGEAACRALASWYLGRQQTKPWSSGDRSALLLGYHSKHLKVKQLKQNIIYCACLCRETHKEQGRVFVSGKEYKTFVLLFISVCLFRAKRLFVSFFFVFRQTSQCRLRSGCPSPTSCMGARETRAGRAASHSSRTLPPRTRTRGRRRTRS
jgi:hypothetical protein